MDENNVKFSDALMPGLILALVSIVFTLLFQFTIEDLELRQYLGYIVWAITLGLTIYFGIQYRNQQGDNGLTYGKSFLYIFYMMVISTIISTIFIYLNYAFIDPASLELIKETAVEKMYEQGQLTDEQIQQAIEMQAKFMTPLWMSISVLFFSAFFSVIISLLAAIFIKRQPKINFE